MSNPRIKRPFAGAASDPAQRQITSFFNTRSATDNAPSVARETVKQPVLPTQVQSNLLSVGMRIRKSVPEGYKTSGHSAFKLWTDTATPAAAKTRSSTTSATGGRELLPFCGINRVGGMGSQPAFVDMDDDEDVPGLDSVPELTLSQESNDSVCFDSQNEPTRKRIFDDDDQVDPVQAWVQNNDWDQDEGISPRSLTPAGNSRIMAVPRTRVKGSTLKEVAIGQENMVVDNDFEEAGFLVYDGSRDMEMSD